MTAVIVSHSRGWSIFLGIVLIIAGLLSIAVPFVAGIAASVFFGWLVLFGAIAHFVYAWSERGAGAIIWQILIGLAYFVAGLYMIFMPVRATFTLTLVLACYILFEGVLEIAIYAHHRRMGRSGWFLFDGIISLLLGALIFFHWPSSSFWALGTLVGISMLFSGIARLTFPMRRHATLAAI
jgi:uncharacterized membrane protein HdeD (DUF308 family)